MAIHYETIKGGYSSAGYGDFGYAPESRESHWNINCRFSITDICLCGKTERELISQRQAEGIAAAKRKGRKFGRPQLEIPDQFEMICQRCYAGKISTRKAAKILGMSHSTFYRKYKKCFKL